MELFFTHSLTCDWFEASREQEFQWTLNAINSDSTKSTVSKGVIPVCANTTLCEFESRLWSFIGRYKILLFSLTFFCSKIFQTIKIYVSPKAAAYYLTSYQNHHHTMLIIRWKWMVLHIEVEAGMRQNH